MPKLLFQDFLLRESKSYCLWTWSTFLETILLPFKWITEYNYIHFHNTSKSKQILQRKFFKNIAWASSKQSALLHKLIQTPWRFLCNYVQQDIFHVKNTLSVLPLPLSFHVDCAEVLVLVTWSVLRPTILNILISLHCLSKGSSTFSYDHHVQKLADFHYRHLPPKVNRSYIEER